MEVYWWAVLKIGERNLKIMAHLQVELLKGAYGNLKLEIDTYVLIDNR